MTALPPASTAPQPVGGTRSRAGNAMARTRAAVIDGALRSVEKHGSRRTTMSDVAALAGIAKATLYNHFRAKPDVFSAVLESEVSALGAECQQVAHEEGLAAALSRAAERLGGHPGARRIAADEPAVLARLTTPAEGGAWPAARAGVAAVLAAGGAADDPAQTEFVLRWLVTHLGAPGGADDVGVAARAITRGLARPAAQVGPAPGWHTGHQ